MSQEDRDDNCNRCPCWVKMANPDNVKRWQILAVIGWAAGSFPGLIFAGTEDSPAMLSALTIITVVMVIITVVFYKFKPWSYSLTMGFKVLNIVLILLLNIVHSAILGSSSLSGRKVISSFGFVASVLYGFALFASVIATILYYVKGPGDSDSSEPRRTPSQIGRRLREDISAQIDASRNSEPPPPYEEVIFNKSTCHIDGLPSYGDVIGGQVTVIATAEETPTSINIEQPRADGSNDDNPSLYTISDGRI